MLRNRLTARGTDSAEDLARRLRGAPAEVEQYRNFQYVILNDDINRASAQLASVIYAERARRERQETTCKEALADFARVGAAAQSK
jgi:guanylate kinase